MNKTNLAVNAKCSQPTQSSSGKLLRSREQVKKAGLRAEEERAAIMFPVIDDLLKGLCDGRSLLGVLMFYEPNVVNMEGMDDSFVACPSGMMWFHRIRVLNHHAQPPSSTTMLNHHPQPPLSAILLNHHAQPPCSTTIVSYPPQPSS